MGNVTIFPRSRLALARSPRVQALESRILEHLRRLQRHDSQETVSEILRLRDEIWRTEAEEATTDASTT